MEEKKPSKQEQALGIIITLLDEATKRGAFSRGEVISYNNAFSIVEKLLDPDEKKDA